MKILIFGATGKVGKALAAASIAAGHDTYELLGRGEWDLAALLGSQFSVKELIAGFKPDVIINATAKNGMEACAADPGSAYAVNAAVPAMLASLARKHDAWFIHFSTDYVFNYERRGTPYAEYDIRHPCGEYGWSKLEGEDAVSHLGHAQKTLIFRLSTIYDNTFTGPLDPLQQAAKNIAAGLPDLPIRVFSQVCAPTSATLIAHAIVYGVLPKLSDRLRKIYHLSTRQGVRREDFVRYTLSQVYGRDDWTFETFSFSLARPEYSVLDCRKFEEAFSYPLPYWKTDFDTCKASHLSLPALKSSPKTLTTAS